MTESETNQRNQEIGMLMYAHGHINSNAQQATGNSARAQKAIADISEGLGGNPYVSRARMYAKP